MRLLVNLFKNVLLRNGASQCRRYSDVSVNLFTNRSHTCGELRITHVGQKVNICGWLEFHRLDKFAIIRDAYGSVQVIIPQEQAEGLELLAKSQLESVISVEGVVALRPEGQVNKKLPTGDVEIIASSFKILNDMTASLPFAIRGYNKPKEYTRMKWRYLDLRFPEMQRNLRLRSRIGHSIRSYLDSLGFIDVETPTLFKRTPGGAQEYIVPTEIPGHFYALVQSPQQLKQLLMIGGIDRYYQFARCYRNEGARPDRQPEFTQLDIEMSFSDKEGVMRLMEGILASSWPSETHGPFPTTPLPCISYDEAFSDYGVDKPDLSSSIKIETIDANCFLEPTEYTCRLLKLPQGLKLFTNSLKKSFEDIKNQIHPKCQLHFFKFGNTDQWKSAVKKSKLPLDDIKLSQTHKIEEGDLIIVGAGHKFAAVTEVLGRMRTEALSTGLLTKQGDWHFLWVVDFPLFTKDDNGQLCSVHHPFTQPHPDDVHLLSSDPLKVRGLHYDLVLNGWEVAGGSVRICNAELQKRIFEMLNIDSSSLQHMLDALASGAPPHAGIAMGMERYISLLVGASSIREVIAFPKTTEGRDTMSLCPAPVSQEELELYNIQVLQRTLKTESQKT